VATQSKINITKVAQLKGHQDAIYDFVVDFEESYIYSAGAEGYVVRWSIDSPADGKLIMQTGEPIYSIHKKNNVLIVGGRSGTIYQVDLQKKSLLQSDKKHQGGIFIITDDFSGGEDGCIVHHSNSLKETVSTHSLRSVAFGKSSIFLGSSDSNIYQLDKETYQIERILKGHTNSVFGLALVDDTTLVSTGRDAQILAHDLKLNQVVHQVPAHLYQAKNLSWNGRLLLSCSMDKTIKIWDDQLNLLKVIDYDRYEGHTNCINKTQWIDENMFVSCSDDRTLVFWKVEIIN
jgi:WD40 repeat protein